MKRKTEKLLEECLDYIEATCGIEDAPGWVEREGGTLTTEIVSALESSQAERDAQPKYDARCEYCIRQVKHTRAEHRAAIKREI